jgi:hypothetical protein
MKKILIIVWFASLSQFTFAQEKDKIIKTCMNYLEGFYEGDTAKLIAALKPSLYKIGYWKNKDSDKYDPDGQMTYGEALVYARRVMEKKNFTKSDAPKKIEVLDIMNTIAAAKVTAWWGVDYVLLSKQGDNWIIEEVLWEGPLEKK